MKILLSKQEALNHYGEAMYLIYSDIAKSVDRLAGIDIYITSNDETYVIEPSHNVKEDTN